MKKYGKLEPEQTDDRLMESPVEHNIPIYERPAPTHPVPAEKRPT